MSVATEKSPSPVYGARLELVYGLIAHRGFESLLLRQKALTAYCNQGFFIPLLSRKPALKQGVSEDFTLRRLLYYVSQSIG